MRRSRLLVLGGRGRSASFDGSRAITFANNESWFDDTSDGPVTAEVTLNGKPLDVMPAWVVVAPPNYGPQRKSVRTMWDLMRDVAVQAKMAGRPGASLVHPGYNADRSSGSRACNGSMPGSRRDSAGREHSTSPPPRP